MRFVRESADIFVDRKDMQLSVGQLVAVIVRVLDILDQDRTLSLEPTVRLLLYLLFIASHTPAE